MIKMDSSFGIAAALAFGVPIAINALDSDHPFEGHTPIMKDSTTTTGKAALYVGAAALLYGLASNSSYAKLALGLGTGALGAAGAMAYYDSQHANDQKQLPPPFPFPPMPNQPIPANPFPIPNPFPPRA